MLNRRRTWLVLAALACVALAVYFEPTHCVRGWLRREAFYDGRPTSYWRGVVDRDLRKTRDQFFAVAPPPPSLWQRCKEWIGYRPLNDSSLQMFQSQDADAVLRELADAADVHISAFAADTLQMSEHDRKIRNVVGGREVAPGNRWMGLILKHNLNGRAHFEP